MEKWLVLDLGQDINRMSLEHLEVLKSKEAFKCDRNNRKITGTILKELQVFKARTMCTAK